MNKTTRLTDASLTLSATGASLVAWGTLVDDHPTNSELKAGTHVLTSEVVSVTGNVIRTTSGTLYEIVA